MKTFLFIMAALLCMASCKKSEPLSANLFGKWEVTRVYGGNIYPPDSLYKPGNGNILQLNSDSTFEHYYQNQLNSQGTFHIRTNGFKNDQSTYDEIYFNSDTSAKSIIFLSGDLLTIKPLIPDIATTEYQKIQN
jgi:hypothetical protein